MLLYGVSRLGKPPACLLWTPHGRVSSRKNALRLVANVHELLDVAPVFAGVLRQAALVIHFGPAASCREVLIKVAGRYDPRQHIARKVKGLHDMWSGVRSETCIE